MADFDLVHSLVDLGVSEKEAEYLKVQLKGEDLINLINSLNNDKLTKSFSLTNNLLSKYGISIQEDKTMSNDFGYYEALASGTIDTQINEWLKPISEANHPDAHMLALEGFNYFTQLDNGVGEKLIDWLDENGVEFLTNGQGHFHIKCGDRESAYKVGRSISSFMKNNVVRDSAHQEDIAMNEKKNTSKINAIKQKIADVKPRNMDVVAMTQRGGGGAHKVDARKKDPMGRGAKHKASTYEEIDYQIGQSVMVGENEGTVKIPNGPDGTVGVMIGGKLSMVAMEDVALHEGVMGMTSVNPLLRLRELAGLPPAAPAPMVDPVDDMGAVDDLGGVDDFDTGAEPDFGAETDFDTGLDGDMGLDAPVDEPEMGVGTLGAPTSMPGTSAPVAPAMGIPGDLPPGGVEVPMGGMGMAPTQSDAMSQIEDHLNNIQTSLADIRLSEYKSLVRKLEDLTNQVRVMGRDYLGERRKK